MASGGGGDKRRLKLLGSCKSKIWNTLVSINDAGIITDKKEVYCTLCYHRLSYSGNITNLFYHLEAKHESQFSEVAPKKKIITEDSLLVICTKLKKAKQLVPMTNWISKI